MKNFFKGSCKYLAVLLTFILLASLVLASTSFAGELEYLRSWVGNTFGGQDKKFVQNYIEQMQVMPDGTIYTSSGWCEGGRAHGIYKDGDVIGNKNMQINTHRINDSQGNQWRIESDNSVRNLNTGVRITSVGRPMGLAATNDGGIMVADNGPDQQVKFFNQDGQLIDTLGDKGGIGSGIPGKVTPTKLWNLSGCGMDDQG